MEDKTYEFFIIFDPHVILATNLQSALKQLKREAGKDYYDLTRVYVVNDQVRYLKQEFIDSLRETALMLARSASKEVSK